MSRSSKLKLVARYEDIKRLRQLSRMQGAKKNQTQQQRLTQQLGDYLNDYQGLNQQSEVPLRASTLRNGSRFVGDLEQALQIQQSRQKVVDEQFGEELQVWRKLYARSVVLDGLIQEAEREESLEELNKEDRVADEQWTTQFSRKA